MTPPTADQLRDYLAPEEPLVAVSAATLSEPSSWKSVSVGITDRRMLCVSDDGRFVTIGYDAIRTIRSRPRTTRTYRGNDYRLLLGSGSIVAVLGFTGVVAFTTSLLVPLLVLVTVSGLSSAEYWRRTGNEFEQGAVARATDLLPYDVDGRDVRQRCESYVPDDLDEHEVLMLGSWVIIVSGAIGLVLLAPGALVYLATLLLVGGSALVDYALRHEDDFGGIEIGRRHETDVRINTDDSGTIHIRSDPSEEIVRELSRVAYMDDVTPDHIVSPHS